MAQLKGIDVSRWQGIIDWDRVKTDDHAQFAIIKLGGSDDGLYMDSRAKRNATEARRLNIPRGYYFYLGGVTDTKREIQHILNCIAEIGGLKPGELVVLDWEESNTVEVAYVTEIAQGMINAKLPKPLIYMSYSRIRSNDWTPLVKLDCGLWVAAWGDNDDIPEDHEVPGSDEWPFWAMWQYSSTGSINGIQGRVDLDIFNGDVDTFYKYGAGGNVTPPPVVPVPPVTPPPTKKTYTAVKGDSMSIIAAKHGMSLQHLIQLNPNAGHPARNYNNIWPGDVFVVSGEVKPTPPATKYDYAKSGDSMSKIAARNNITLTKLKQLNPKAGHPAGNYDVIWPGDRFRVA